MENTLYFLFEVTHLQGEGFNYAALAVSQSTLEKLRPVRGQLEAVCKSFSESAYGSVTVRGLGYAVLIQSHETSGELEELLQSVPADETALPITEEQFQMIESANGAYRSDCGGFCVSTMQVRWTGYPRHGDGLVESKASFEELVFTKEAAKASR